MSPSHRARRAARAGLWFLSLLLATGTLPAAAAEFLQNGTFDGGTVAPWWATANTSATVVDGRMCVAVPAGTVNVWDAIVGQNDVALEQGKSYTFSFVASADAPVTIKPVVQLAAAPYTGTFSEAVELGADVAAYTFTFTNDLPTGPVGVQFQVGGNAAGFTFCVDDVAVSGAAPAQERVVNGTFDDGSTQPWWTTSGTSAAVVDGRMCVSAPAGTVNAWDAIVGQGELELVEGQQYALSFVASADVPVTIKALVQLPIEPYSSTLSEPVALDSTPKAYRYVFTNSLPTGALGLQFQMGGAAAAFTVCFDDVSLTGATGPGYVPDTGPAVRVNQVGYVPFGPKRANVVTDATTAQTWELVDAAGKVVTSGLTTVHGADAASGDTVHLIDFSRFHRPGDGYTLRVGEAVSYPFRIAGNVYDALRYDAVAFFYHQRSGIEIEEQYVGARWARPAGHLGVAPNQGDTAVPCVLGVCDYTLDVRGGWYDAGDQGKYVVNGGISVWQLVNTWERAQWHRGALRDGTQKIPEQANGVPDILDEARWELEFLLRMQVPQGQPYAGMAHHKMHDDAWTGIPTRPDLDPQPRRLRGVSTAATLNLAATAAQCARVWRNLDRAFAKTCLVAAERAWAAAKANPAVSCAPGGGGGDYGDQTLTDELYWAAAELFATTGKRVYEDAVRSSPVYLAKGISENGYSWGDVAALGDFTLALVPNKLPLKDQLALRKAIAALADQRIATMKSQGYPVPIGTGGYYWGSNSQILNQITILALAFDLTWDLKYRQAAFEAMDYILGRNALNLSYVTGYGSKYAQNQHHRFWAHQANAAYPNPPAGSVAGGANAQLQDPVAASKLKGCAPAKCYIDHFESYATNEVAINWNSALAWTAAWLADHAGP